jgi:hypothetical protein
MLNQLRRGWGEWITSGGQLLLLFVGGQIDSPLAWRCVAGAIALLSVPAWLSALRRARMVADTPTSQVASAAQGYVELQGRGKSLQGLPVLSPLNQLPCLWYRYRIERRRDNKWETVERGESDASFLLDDGTGQCLVDPEGAEIIVEHRDQWTSGNQRYTQWLILNDEPVYAIGAFITRSGDSQALSVTEDMKALLAEWKRDMPALLKRFDLDGDGRIDLEEWGLARQQARREVEIQHRELREHPDLHLMGLPADGRLYLIATLPPARIERRYRLWSIAHLLIFVVSLGWFGWLLQQPWAW